MSTSHPKRGAKRAPGAYEIRQQRLADEVGTLFKDAPIRIGLCYPNPYRVAMSSLGYQVIYRMINERPEMACERIILPDDGDQPTKGAHPIISMEGRRQLLAFQALAFSVTFDLDITGFFAILSGGGVPILRSERGPRHPPVILGGPLTASNPLPFGPVIGDGEVATPLLLDVIAQAIDRDDMVEQAAKIRGVWVPEIHGDAVPATEKVSIGLPAYGQITTPHAELSDMFLVEASRGCPRFCKFCLVRAVESPMRENDVEAVMARIPEHAKRVGLVGAAVSEWHGVRETLKRCVDRGLGVGISSLRADRLDEEFVDLLARGGYRTMTVASDAPSQRLRNKMAKGLKAKHLVRAAQLAKQAGMIRLKVYMIIGLPDENEEDIAELVSLTKELASILPVALGISPLVPKLHTPLGDAPFAGIRPIQLTLKDIRKQLGGSAEIRGTSARWAWVEYRMSQGGQDAGRAALAAWRRGGNFRAWEQAMEAVDERAGLAAALAHGKFDAAGMK